MTASPHVSVVMPTYNRSHRLPTVLDALQRQRVDADVELVVVSDGSTDGTDDVLAGFDFDGTLRVLRQTNQGPAAARNNGVREARGDLIVFVDDDIVAGDGLFQAHLDAHRRLGDDAVVIGPMLDPPDFDMQPWVRWEQAMLRKQYAAMDAGEYEATPRQFYTGNASVRREHLLRAGGFDESFRRAEDVELAFRLGDLGLRFAYVADAVGYHYAERSYDAWKSAAYVYGRNEVVFARDRGRTWLFAFMAEKYRSHRPEIRLLASSCIRLPRLRGGVTGAFHRLAAVGERLGRERLTLGAYSAIYGIEFHSGIADELGGPDRFFELVRDGATSSG